MRIKNRVKGSSLFYAVIIALLIGVVLLSLSSLNFYKSVEFELHLNSSRLNSNCNSAQAILFSEYHEKSQDTWHKVNELEDSCFYSYSPWGLYFLGKTKSHILQDTLQKTFLFGERWNNDGVAIHLKNGISGLHIAGKTKLVGNARVPGGKIKPSFSANQSFNGNEIITGTVSEPERPFPSISMRLREIITELNPKKLRLKCTGSFSKTSKFLKANFNEDGEILCSSDSISLNGYELLNHVIICSQKAIYLGSLCKAENIIVSAPRIYVAKGFKGSVQCFSSEKIIIQENAQLNYPSSAVLWGSDADEIEIGTNSILEGNIIISSQNPEKTTLEIKDDSRISGVVYSEVSTQLKGSIHGQIITNEFFLKTGSGYYKNHLLNAEVDVSKLPKWFCGIPLNYKDRNPIIISSE